MIAVTAAALALALSPPVIHERFTPLPCPKHPRTTLDLEGCGEQAVLRTDKRINGLAAAIFKRIGTRAGKAEFVDGEHAWLRYRRESCAVESSVYAGGSFEPVAFVDCEAGRNRRHVADLAETLKFYEQH